MKDLRVLKKIILVCITLILFAGSVMCMTACSVSKEDKEESEEEEEKENKKSSKGKKIVGEDIKAEDIKEFYYTVENINYDAYYQRYYFYVEGGEYFFYHETRERKDDYGPTTEEDITNSGTVKLDDRQWEEFFDMISDGEVEKRKENTEAGDDGPWMYLYWDGDKDKYQEYSFGSRKKLKAFVEYCENMAGASSAGTTRKDDDYSGMTANEAFEKFASSFEYIKGNRLSYETAIVDYSYNTDTSGMLTGYLDYHIADYDGDGEDEMLLAELRADAPIKLTLYEFDGHYICDTAVYESYGPGYDIDYQDTYVFFYEFDGVMIIGIGEDDSVGYIADGRGIELSLLTYSDGDGFFLEDRVSYAGSDMMDEDGFAATLRSYGINVTLESFDIDRILAVTRGSQLFRISITTTGEKKTKDADGWEIYEKLYKSVEYQGYASADDLHLEDAYILPYSSEYYLEEWDLEGLSNEELRRARNEIVARYGRRFEDEELQAYFDKQSWYHGTIDPDDFNKKITLSDVERENMEFIKKHEN